MHPRLPTRRSRQSPPPLVFLAHLVHRNRGGYGSRTESRIVSDDWAEGASGGRVRVAAPGGIGGVVGGRNERGCEVACEPGGRGGGEGQGRQGVDMAYRRYGVSGPLLCPIRFLNSKTPSLEPHASYDFHAVRNSTERRGMYRRRGMWPQAQRGSDADANATTEATQLAAGDTLTRRRNFQSAISA